MAVETAELFADDLRPQQDLLDAGEVLEIIESRLDPEDGEVDSVELDARYHAMQVVSQAACSDSADCPYVYRMRDVVMHAAYVAGFRVASPSVDTVAWNRAEVAERRLLARFVREVFVDPFRSSPLLPEWRTRTAVLLARQMYESRDFSAMPIFADALQDAGCDNADILNHCRGPGPHVRGCWVVDLVLGNS
ncbi:hypothetical protein R5W23_000037 [Gemmata sp. JC673]|uniref:SMI1/KNR4 family protein n=1 Tax=Gemmata algarum TaxID=2975278 RepID=A0ABU5EQ79_9BACT|nr:hypothetical protein [Gemmata algarum]MDY3557511.1 hypothetical protein [Gemmata algarum]